MANHLFQTFDFQKIQPTEHAGDSGRAFWQTVQLEGLRVRIVEYSAGYLADHWCQKGHVVFVLEGDFVSENGDGSDHFLEKGMAYVVSDGLSSHRSRTEKGCKLLIVDGDFLR